MARLTRWADCKTTQFENLDPQKVVAILPTAAIEQHGPHLPVGVDTFLNEGMLATVEALLPELAPDVDVRILPVQAIGKSNEHLHAPGTLTLPADLALGMWTQIGLSVAPCMRAQAHHHQFPWRQPRHHLHRFARASRAGPHAVRKKPMGKLGRA